MRPHRAVPLLLAAGLLAACGSTATVTGAPVAQDGSLQVPADGLSAPTAPGAPTVDGGTAGGPAAPTTPTAPGGGPAPAAPVGAGSPTSPTRVGAPLVHGPGVSARSIAVGVVHSSNADAQQAALGAGSGAKGSTKDMTQAVVNDINRTGGAGGRVLAPIYYDQDAYSAETQASVEQTLCEFFTRDNKVLLAMLGDTQGCYRKAGVATVTATLATFTEAELQARQTAYDVAGPSLDSVMRNLVDALVASNYFVAWDTVNGAPGGTRPVKVGIVAPDDPPGMPVAIQKVLLPELKKRGVTVDPDHVRIWPQAQSAADNAAAVAAIQNAQLRFASDGVTHVLPMEVNSLAFFGTPAENQRYRPRYGVNTATAAGLLAGQLTPYEQLKGAVGLGWLPSIDLTANDSAKPAYAGPGRARCLSVMDKAGITFPSTNAAATALSICDQLYSFRDAANQTVARGEGLTAAALVRSVEGLGARFGAAGVPSATFGPGRRYAVSRGWLMAWSEECRCQVYRGAARSLR